ncbi:MAG: YegP family protein, partial [Bacteroidota bacterium]
MTLDKYDFTRRSQSGKAGFERFKTEDKYYFHFNDEAGNAILYSQAYTLAKNRDNGIQSVLVNVPNPVRFEKAQEGGKPFFILRAANRQEIARSPFFNSEKKMEEALKFLATANSKTPIHDAAEVGSAPPEEKEKAKTPAPAATKEAVPLRASEPFPKYQFKIDWYPESNSGKISHVVSGGESRQLNSVDGEAIASFIRSCLPQEIPQKKEEKQPVALSRNGRQAQFAEQHKIEHVSLFEQNHLLSGLAVPGSPAIQLGMEINREKLLGLQRYRATVVAKSFENKSRVPVGETSSVLSSDGKVSVPLSLNDLPSGIYQLVATVQLGKG